jgi:Zn-dependent protease with chaperone function
MYFLLGISLIFALLLAVNVLFSAAAEIVWRAVSPLLENWSARNRAQFIFALSVLPLAGALVVVFAFLLPAYVLFEPLETNEVVTAELALLSFISLIGIAIASFRVFGTRRATRRLVSNWLERAERISVENVKIPIYRIPHFFPVIAVIGTFRPRMFIAEKVLDSITPEELQAAIAHEHGHLKGFDNFKRTILRVCRDLLIFPLGKTLERAWTENAESAADEFVAQTGGNSKALDLAAALVKIARIAPQNASPAMPLGSFLIEKNDAQINGRVRRLVQLGENLNSPASPFKLRIAFQVFFAFGILSIIALATNYDFLFRIHTIMEKIVAALQ